MKRPLVRALQGMALSVVSPLGWLVLQWIDGSHPLLQLAWHPGVYLYMLAGTAIVFAAFGWFVGRNEEEYLETSLHDSLTGLYNRRYFWRRLGEEQGFAERHQRPLSLLIGDIDWFKRVNDTYGHSAGDKVLAAIAGVMMSLHRRGDTVARVGGEEFALILPETDLPEAVHVAERLREAIGALRFPAGPDARKPYAVTMSFGAVTSPSGLPLDPTDLFERADAAMYMAKQSGRNRVATLDPWDRKPQPRPAAAGA